MPSSSRRGGTGQSKQLAVIKNLVALGDYHYSGKVRQFIVEGWNGRFGEMCSICHDHSQD